MHSPYCQALQEHFYEKTLCKKWLQDQKGSGEILGKKVIIFLKTNKEMGWIERIQKSK